MPTRRCGRRLWRRRCGRACRAVATLLLALLAAVAVGEWLGWPWLAAPLQRLVSQALDRRVSLGNPDGTAAPDGAGAQIRFLGGLRLRADRLEIAAPPWSTAPHLLRAGEVELEMRYTDLWHAWRGGPLRIHRLQAATLDAQLERLADGRVSWQFDPRAAPAEATLAPAPLPQFGQLQVASGTLRYHDAVLAIDAEGQLSLVDRALPLLTPGERANAPTRASAGASAAAAGAPTTVLQASASGHFRQAPLHIELSSSGVMPWADDRNAAQSMPLTLRATIGRSVLTLEGSAVDVLHLRQLDGHFSLTGPSLAAVGDPLGVTLPTTGPFRAVGLLAKQGDTWNVRVDDATVGGSRLGGAFTFERGRRVPLLSGRLTGSRLLLADLGPAVGTTPVAAASRSPPAASAASARPVPPAPAARQRGRVLPDRSFDLAALRAMDADVLIDIREVDLNTRRLEPLRPLRGHLQLAGGVLSLHELDARTGQGRLSGELRLDGRESPATWTAELSWSAVQLEQWIDQRSAARGSPDLRSTPYLSGRLSGQATLSGRGRSTAEVLASLNGHIRGQLDDGHVSHLALELAGLDVAQGLGVMLKGDDMLPVHCAVAELDVAAGVLRPRPLVLDTSDSTVWIDGSLSLADETLDLRVVLSPRDFSLLALRTPLRLRGSFSQPSPSLDMAPLAPRLAAAFLLALVNPVAALLPLLDPAEAAAAGRSAAACQALVRRHATRITASPARR